MLLTGCSTTVPVARNFPDVPQELKEQCAPLAQVKKDTTKLSEVITVVTGNYTEYHKCNTKVDMWIEWYTSQKEIFESVK